MPKGIYLRTEYHRQQISKAKKGMVVDWVAKGEKHHRWRGDNIRYQGLHKWVRKILGKPNRCDHCGATEGKRFEWANKSQKYLRDINDWLRLCTSCHRKYDYGL